MVGKVSLTDNNTTLSIAGADGTALGTLPISEVDSVVFLPVKPIADLLDIQFKEDGTAEDLSAMKMAVQTTASGALQTYYSPTYQRYVARFSNTWGGSTSGFYRIDYADNQEFKDKLADGHTLEAVVMANYEPPIQDKEAKFFSSHESGGTGLMVCKAGKGLSDQSELDFLPHVGGSWRHAGTGVVPVPQQYYHIVGVWNKEEGKTYVYLDGKLMSVNENAKGEFKFPNANSNWFAIGCDAGPTAQLGWSGDVVLARAYDKPLSAAEVRALWSEIDNLQQNAQPDLVSNVSFLSGLPIKAGQSFSITADGFADKDKVRFMSTTDNSDITEIEGTLDGRTLQLPIPDGFESGEYRMTLVRGNNVQDLGRVSIVIVTVFPKAPGIVAHRGYYAKDNAAQNSLAALKNSQEAGLFGSETDVWLTTDGYLVINHDQKIGGVEIQDNPYSAVANMTLSNGEKLPQLQDFLKELQDKSKTTKLFIEVKTHNSSAKNMAVVKAITDAVKEYDVEDRVQYIAFNIDVCKELTKYAPAENIGYLNGDLTPTQLNAAGVKGIHYSQKLYRENPTWMDECHQLGITINVQGVNTQSDMAEMINMGADLISTDDPASANEIRNYYLENAEN